MIGLMGTTVEIIRTDPPELDDYGDPIIGTGEITYIPVPYCSVQNVQTGLNLVEAGVAITPLTTFVVFMPAGTELVTGSGERIIRDKIRINGIVYTIDGSPVQLTSSISGHQARLAVPLKK